MCGVESEREIRLLHDLVACYSPSGRERPAGELLLGVLRDWGWDARLDEVGNVVGEIGSAPPTICFLGHIDTVAGEIPVRTDGGRLYGRGAVDAKGPLAAAACAASRLLPDPGKHIVLVAAVEEETPTSRGARHIAQRITPDYAIVGEPSRWDRVTIGYKGILHFRYTLVVPRAHGAAESPCAATRAIDFFNALRASANKGVEQSPFRSLTANVRSFETQLREFDETARMTVDLRLPPSLDPDRLERTVRDLAAGADIEIIEKLPAVMGQKNNRLVRAFLAAIRGRGGRPRFALKTGTSDMNVVAPAWNCPILAYGPGDSRLDHTPDEHLDLDEYRKAIDVLEAAFRSL